MLFALMLQQESELDPPEDDSHNDLADGEACAYRRRYTIPAEPLMKPTPAESFLTEPNWSRKGTIGVPNNA